ncbi:hypothetical protein [Paenibacillus tianjinensis]|uniref:Uncharacterized protein n=1 Tax=Paenibacillus tianjinensis TaxID=2810347 RepID=A0ABX7L5J9_9BACL|nr:hypothetical protein [Paenibacillus tianjinensis]QSF43328.1 hypothetical protein JRJ22_18855 [Paenibacillus tianjinensis]
MKMTGIYLILACLNLGMIVFVDLLSGTSLPSSLHSLRVVFDTTTFQESCFMVLFAALPVIVTVADKFKQSKSPRK